MVKSFFESSKVVIITLDGEDEEGTSHPFEDAVHSWISPITTPWAPCSWSHLDLPAVRVCHRSARLKVSSRNFFGKRTNTFCSERSLSCSDAAMTLSGVCCVVTARTKDSGSFSQTVSDGAPVVQSNFMLRRVWSYCRHLLGL